MSGSSLLPHPDGRSARLRADWIGVGAAYGLLGGVLLVTRLAELGHSLWLDEAHFVENFVRADPRKIVASGGSTHQLYALVDWMTRQAVGESVVGFRLWSAVPFVFGVGLVTVWLHRRVGALAGVLFVFLATVSPMLLDLSRQARGYGMAFLAMSVLVVAALEAERTGRAAAVVAMFVAGLVGTLTLPQFGFAFVATALVLLLDRRIRLGVVLGLLFSIAALVLWYAPHSEQVEAASQGTAGTVQTSTAWLITAPIDQIVLPALIWLEGPTVKPRIAWLPFVLLVAVVMALSPLLRRRGSALILCAGPAVTVTALWLADAYVAPRFLSFLLVPLFMLVASGAAATFTAIPARWALVPAAVCLVTIAALSVRFAELAPDVVRLPREANRDAAETIERGTLPTTPVYAQLKDPIALQFYLDRPIQIVQPDEVAQRVCTSLAPVVYVVQPWAITLVDVPCLRTRVVEHYRFEQYARGGEIDVWFVPGEA